MPNIKEIKEKYYKKIDLLDIELIISRVIKKPREFVLTHPEFKLTTSQMSKVKSQMSRRMRHEPLAYIFGEKEFYGLKFKVNKNTLVPRPETELMVEEAIKQLTMNNEQLTIIDVGTGSGCIIITLVKSLNSKLKTQNSKFFATDISEPALRIARKNTKLHSVDKKIKFMHGNLLEPIIKQLSKVNCQRSIVITANLPYLTPIQVKNSPSIQYEPKLALDAGKDGLKYYKQLFKQIKLLVTNYRLPVTALLEIDPSQTAKIKKEIKIIFPKAKIATKKDLRGLCRLIIVKI